MESLRRHWALAVLILGIVIGAIFLYRATEPREATEFGSRYLYHSNPAETRRVNKDTGVQEIATKSGWQPYER